MTTVQNKQSEEMVALSGGELQEIITNAIKKVGCKRENDLCRYLPMSNGGYMHHFTMKKMKTQLPGKLAEMLKNFVINPNKPVTVPPKQRAARGSRKKRDLFVIPKQEIDKILSLARAAGDRDLIRRLLPKRDLGTIKRELISSIRHNRLEPELWHSFTEALSQQQ
jgi:hypothetical protein